MEVREVGAREARAASRVWPGDAVGAAGNVGSARHDALAPDFADSGAPVPRVGGSLEFVFGRVAVRGPQRGASGRKHEDLNRQTSQSQGGTAGESDEENPGPGFKRRTRGTHRGFAVVSRVT